MTGSVSRAAGGTASGAEIRTVTPGGAVGTGSPHLIVSIGARSVSRSNRSSTEMASSDRLTSVKVSRSPSASTVRSRRSQTVGSALGTPTPRRIPTNCSVDALVTPCPIGSGSAPSTVTTARANTRTSAHKHTLRAGAAELPVRRREADRGSAERHRQVVQQGLPGSHGVIVASEALKGR